MEGRDKMNKQCKACGSNVPNDAKFCQVCGGSNFIINNTTQQTGINNNSTSYQQGYNQNQYEQRPPVNQTWQQPIPQNQTKKKKTGLIIGIVVAVLVVLAGIGMVAEKEFQDQGYGNNDISNNDDYSFNIGDNNNSLDDSSFYDESEKVYYTKGTFDGSVYVNEWSDIKFALPEGFSNADLATYNAAENSNTECGAYFIADDTMSLIYICYEKLPTYPSYDEEEYLDVALKSLKSLTEITYTVPDTYSTATIGGYTYAKAECEFNNGIGNFSNTIYVRKLDDYIIFISAVGINPELNAALVSNIGNVK